MKRQIRASRSVGRARQTHGIIWIGLLHCKTSGSHFLLQLCNLSKQRSSRDGTAGKKSKRAVTWNQNRCIDSSVKSRQMHPVTKFLFSLMLKPGARTDSGKQSPRNPPKFDSNSTVRRLRQPQNTTKVQALSQLAFKNVNVACNSKLHYSIRPTRTRERKIDQVPQASTSAVNKNTEKQNPESRLPKNQANYPGIEQLAHRYVISTQKSFSFKILTNCCLVQSKVGR